MTIKNTTAYSSIAYIAVFCQLLTWIGRPMDINILVSISVAATTIAAAIALVFIYMDKGGIAHKANDFPFLVCLFLLVALCAVLSHPVNLTLLKKLFVFFQLPILMMVAKRGQTGRVRDVIYSVNAFYPVLCLYYYTSSFSHRYIGRYGETAIDELTLGFANPNETAIYLMLCAFFLWAAFFRYKSLGKRIFLLVEFLWILFLVYQTECRAVAVVLIAVVFGTLAWKKMCLTKKFMRIAFISAALLAVALSFLPNVGKLVFMGDALDTGRTSIFAGYIRGLSFMSFLWGDFETYPLNNMHNAFLSLLASFGIFAAIACWFFYYRGYVSICAGKPNNMEQKVLQLSSIAIVFHSAVESSLLTSGAIYAVSSFLVLFMAFGTEVEKSE